MAKESGLGAGLFINGVDLSGDTQSVDTISKAIKIIPQTGIDKHAMERAAGVLDGSLAMTNYFDPTNAHIELKKLPRTDVVVSYMHKQSVLGTPVASMVAKQTSYDGNRKDDGSLLLKVEALSNSYWLDWGYSLTTGKRADTAATNGTGVDFNDFGGGASYGLQAYCHLFAFTGTSATIKLQQSSDNGVGDAWSDVTGGSFGALSAVGASRIATSRTQAVERYLRVVTSGVFSAATFTVAVTVNDTDYPL
jgi:hypothetical protein